MAASANRPVKHLILCIPLVYFFYNFGSVLRRRATVCCCSWGSRRGDATTFLHSYCRMPTWWEH